MTGDNLTKIKLQKNKQMNKVMWPFIEKTKYHDVHYFYI